MLFSSGAKNGRKPVAGELIKEATTATFVSDVLEASRDVPVIVDFWAPWCGPCKTLGPLLEKLVHQAAGAVRLVKVDVDANQALAAQMRIQSIPAVYAFRGGRPVDGFVGALPESQVKAFLARLIGDKADTVPELGELLAEAKALLDSGQPDKALAAYREVLAADPENVAAIAGSLRCLVQAGRTAEAKKVLDGLPAELAKESELAAVRVAIELAEQAADAGPTAELERAVAAAPDDPQKRFDLAMAYYARGNRQGAVDQLLELFRRNRAWNDDAARKQLIKLFEAFGPTDPLTVAARRRLSSLMFA
jgi:putative thioredoxin